MEEGLGRSDGPYLVEESRWEMKVNQKDERMKNRKDPAEMKVIRLKSVACIHITMQHTFPSFCCGRLPNFAFFCAGLPFSGL